MSKPIGRRGALKPIRHHIDAIYQAIAMLTPKQRRNLRKQLGRVGTHCSWTLYGAKPLLLDMLDMASPGVRFPKEPTKEKK
jgi:hypothetical protein